MISDSSSKSIMLAGAAAATAPLVVASSTFSSVAARATTRQACDVVRAAFCWGNSIACGPLSARFLAPKLQPPAGIDAGANRESLNLCGRARLRAAGPREAGRAQGELHSFFCVQLQMVGLASRVTLLLA